MNRKLKIEELGRKSVDEFKKTDKFPVIIVLENIRSLNNIGSVFRTADAFGIEAIYLVGFTARPPHRDINKTAIGATESVTWEYFENSIAAIEKLQSLGYTVLSIEQTDHSRSLEEIKWKKGEKLALFLGNELTGVEQETIDRSVFTIEVPQFGTKHSLNISVTAGVVLWDILSSVYLNGYDK